MSVTLSSSTLGIWRLGLGFCGVFFEPIHKRLQPIMKVSMAMGRRSMVFRRFCCLVFLRVAVVMLVPCMLLSYVGLKLSFVDLRY